MDRFPSRLCTSVHEAGHAVIQLANPPAPWIRSIAVDGLDEGLLGLVDTSGGWQPYMATVKADPEIELQWRDLARMDVRVLLAGPIAELKWRRYPRVAIWMGADQMAARCLSEEAQDFPTDFWRVHERLRYLSPGRERECFIESWMEAEDQVSRWWLEIKRLGRTLADRGRIDDEGLSAIWDELKAARSARSRSRPKSDERAAQRGTHSVNHDHPGLGRSA